MLVLANGAFKSGSTWLYAILRATETFQPLPEAYSMDVETSRQWLKPGLVEAFLDSGVHQQTDYLAKGHYFEDGIRDTLLSYEGVYVLNIKRDVRDSLVAHFFHLIRQGKLSESLASPERRRQGFSEYYWRLGRYKAQQIMMYHRVWDTPSPRVYISSFERLKTEFEDEVREVGLFLGLHFSPADIAELRRRTSLETLQKAKGHDTLPEHKRFFRKGLIGEWRDYFDSEILADVEKIQDRGLGAVDMVKYRAIFGALTLRRRWLGR